MTRPLVLALLFAVGLPSRVIAADDLDALLARPVTPGTLALMIPFASDSRVAATWDAALKSPDPAVRGVAARLFLVSAAQSRVPALQRALLAETDQATAVEIAHALLGLAGRDVDPAVVDAVARLRSAPLAIALAQARGVTTANFVEQFRALQLSASARDGAVTAIIANDARVLHQVGQAALDASDGDLWLSTLNVADQDKIAVDPSLLRAALTSTSTAIRDLGWWYMAVHAAEKDRLPDVSDLPPALPAQAASLPELAFGRELWARQHGTAPTPQTELLARARGRPDDVVLPKFGKSALLGPLNDQLTGVERDGLDLKASGPPAITEGPSASSEREVVGGYPTIRTVANLPIGLVADLLRQTECKVGEGEEVAGMVVDYGDQTSAPTVQWTTDRLTAPCRALARLILILGVRPVPQRNATQRTQLVVLPVHRTFMKCLAQAVPYLAPDESAYLRVGPELVTPKRIRNITPTYPPLAQVARVGGTVSIESTVGTSGCIEGAEVLTGSRLDLDLAALRAVTDWLFAPMRWRGKPVPVTLRTTLRFTPQ